MSNFSLQYEIDKLIFVFSKGGDKLLVFQSRIHVILYNSI